MSDINNNININVQSGFSSYGSLMEKLESVKNKFGEIGEVKGVKRLTKYLEKVKDPISTIDKMLDTLNKKIAQTQDKISIAKIQRNGTRELESQLKKYENVQKAIYSFVENNPELKNKIVEEAFSQQTNEENLKKAQEQLNAFERSLDPVKKETYELEQDLKKAREEFIKLAKAGQDTKSAEKDIKRINNQIIELQNSTKKTSSQFKILLTRIKNIAIYRTIRRSLQIIFQTITKGFERVTKLSDDAEQTALRLKADYNLIATAIGSIAYTILNSLIGNIDNATDSMVELLNSFNKVLALSLGSDRYFRVVRKGIEGINQSTQKLSFDKFESLSKEDESTLGVDLEEVELTNNEINNLTNSEQNLYNILESVKSILGSIWEVASDLWTGIIIPIMNSGVLKFIIDIASALITIIDKLKLIQIVIVALIAIKIVSGILKVTSAIKGMSVAWKTTLGVITAFVSSFLIVDSILSGFSGTSKVVVSSILAIVSAGVALWTVLWAIKNAWNWVSLAGVAVAGGVLLASIKGIADGASEMSIKGYKNGGTPDKAELFYMNENGIPEALINTGGSNTNVYNISQLAQGVKQGFIEAIYETGLIDAMQNKLTVEGRDIDDNAFARAIFPALKTESKRRGGNQL